MENDHLRFACPSCGTNLTLPAAAAGVEGPCPQCQSVIRAPRPLAVRLEVPDPEPVRARPAVTIYHGPAPAPAGSGVVKAGKQASLKRNSAIGASVVLIGVATWIMLSPGKEKAPLASVPLADASSNVSHPQSSALPKAPALDPALDPRIPPEGMDVRGLIQESADVLKNFLLAETLAERLPLIETKTPREELEASVIAGPIPSRQRFQSMEVRFDKVGGASDVIFLGEFELPTAGAESHVVMVRKRGTQVPKVIVDPFLDGYGGRLRKFAAAPADSQRTFQVIASFFDFCNDSDIPNAASKYTAKLSEAAGRPEVAEAYFAAVSPVKERLEKLGVRYGHSTGVTFALRWNTEDDPAKPFLEVVSVQALDWND